MKRWLIVLTLVWTGLLMTACGNNNQEGTSSSEKPENSPAEETTEEINEKETDKTENVTVSLKDRDENDVGTAELKQQDDGVNIKLSASHLPEGTHGFHIHEKATCEAPDYESAGGHFNPTKASHGTDSEDGPHAGDLPNIEVNEDGTVEDEVTADMVTLEEGEDHSLLSEEGTSLVIHAEADDNESQPSGDAGDRIACGVMNK